MNAKYTVAALVLASAGAMAAPETSNINTGIELTEVTATADADIDGPERAAEAGSLESVGEKLERALDEQLLEDMSAEMPVIELIIREGDIAEIWPVPTGEKVGSTS